MDMKVSNGMKIIQCLSGVFLMMSLLYFILGELFSEKEEQFKIGASQSFDDGWVMVNDDGTKDLIVVPGPCGTKSGDVLRIEKTLPNDIEDSWLCIRSTQQDITIAVDGEIRTQYSTKGTRKFGKNSVSVYVFSELYSSDAGKTISMEIVSNSPYSGYVNNMILGDREQLWTTLLEKYLPVTVLAMFMLLLSAMLVCYCLIVRFAYRKNLDIVYLGLALLVASVWIISESKLRQVFLPNSTIASDVGFFMIMLLPFPFLSYINKIQKCRYEKGYMIIGTCSVVNSIVSTMLQIKDIKDFSETMGVSHAIIIAFILFMLITVVIDIKKQFIKDYKEVAFGLAGLMLAGIVEIYQVYDEAAVNNGIALCVGLVFLFFMSVIQTGRDLLQLEKEKQIAVAASQSRTMFLANMSHEIRTPINTIVGMNEMILRENHNNDTMEYAKNINNATKQLIVLIDDILDFSKLDAGKLEICENPYNLASMIRDVFLGARLRLEDKALEVNLDVDKNLPSVLNGDEVRIKQIFNNLLSNAIKYTEEGSIQVNIKGTMDEDVCLLEISVEDTGVGIKEEDLPTLFDSFQRMELKRNKYIQGTGLGLSITKQLVDNMHGTIYVESKYGKGSKFVVAIPQKVVDYKAIGDFQEAKYEIESNNQNKEIVKFSSDKLILVVDDNEMNLMVMKALLGKSGLNMDFASGGLECVEKCKARKYDLIFMDHMMPEPDGIETLHLIRDDVNGKNQQTTVVVLTANAIKGASEQYEKEGFAGYITKPVEYSKVEEMLMKYLGDTTKGYEGNGVDIPEYVLDRQEGLKYCGDLEDLYQEVLEEYVKNATSYKEELHKHLMDENWKEYARVSHTLKSNSLTIGLKEFSEIAKEHEFAGKAEDKALITEKFNYYVACIEASIKAVKDELNM